MKNLLSKFFKFLKLYKEAVIGIKKTNDEIDTSEPLHKFTIGFINCERTIIFTTEDSRSFIELFDWFVNKNTDIYVITYFYENIKQSRVFIRNQISFIDLFINQNLIVKEEESEIKTLPENNIINFTSRNKQNE